MKKIPTLFTRIYENHKIIDILPEITPGCEEAFKNGIATVKVDGSCCAIIGGNLYKRYDAKNGKKPPVGSIPCCDPDPVTGHWPHWVKVDLYNKCPADKWFVKAFYNTVYPRIIKGIITDNGTYEAIGPHFQGNPYSLENDILVRHGSEIVEVRRDFESVRQYLNKTEIEGLVFWLNGEPICKIKRTDFGYEWPVKEA